MKKFDISVTIIFSALLAGRFFALATTTTMKDGRTNIEDGKARYLHWQHQTTTLSAKEQLAADSFNHQSQNLRSSSNSKVIIHDGRKSPQQENKRPADNTFASAIHFEGQGKWTVIDDRNDNSPSSGSGNNSDADMIEDIIDWTDVDGDNCTWYEINVAAGWCTAFDIFENYGLSASQACTHCGGGLQIYQYCTDLCERIDPPECECYPKCYVDENSTTASSSTTPAQKELSCSDPLNLNTKFDPDKPVEKKWCVCDF